MYIQINNICIYILIKMSSSGLRARTGTFNSFLGQVNKLVSSPIFSNGKPRFHTS